jgi:phenylacetic acid degradation operon negative regulatory protein
VPSVDLWTVLWHAIPEAQRMRRSRFASRLRFLGFGSVQDGTWVAARDREQEVLHLLRQFEIEPYVSVMVGHMSPELPPVALVAEAWKLDDTRERYEAFLSEYGHLDTARARQQLSSAEAFRTRTLLLHRFRAFPSVDPELPAAVDRLRELRGQAVACFEAVYEALEPPATKYFWATVRPDL